MRTKKMKHEIIYLDNNSTTPTDPRVLEMMWPYFYEQPGNASSQHHHFGRVANDAVAKARRQVAHLIQVEDKEIIFTSGATESINLAIRGIYESYSIKGNHIITVKTEHNAVLDICKRLEKQGARVSYLDVNAGGIVDVNQLENEITDQTILVSVMWANNETGVLQPMKEIGQICQNKGVLLMSDATQAVGKIKVNPKEVGVSICVFSAHKMYGPKGVGAIYISHKNPRLKLTPQIYGGGHEKGMRSGTLNVPGIVGLGHAALLADNEIVLESQRLVSLRNKLEVYLTRNIEECRVNGQMADRLPHVTNLSFKCVEGQKLLMSLNNKMAISTGSACTSASSEPSHVLKSMGLSTDMAKSSVRISLGRFNKEEDIDLAIKWIAESVHQLRSVSPLWEMYKDGMDFG